MFPSIRLAETFLIAFIFTHTFHTELIKKSRRKSSSQCGKNSEIHFKIKGRHFGQDVNYKRTSEFTEKVIVAVIITYYYYLLSPTSPTGALKWICHCDGF